jgi:hypothetical protein
LLRGSWRQYRKKCAGKGKTGKAEMKGKKPPDHTFQLNCRNREAAALLNISALQRLFQARVWLPAYSKNILIIIKKNC